MGTPACPTHPQGKPDGSGAGDSRLPTHNILRQDLEGGLRVIGTAAVLWGGGAEVDAPRASPCPHQGLTVSPLRPHRGQNVFAVAIEHKPLPVEGDHVSFPIEGAGGRAVDALLTCPLPPRAGAGGGAGRSGVSGRPGTRAPPHEADLHGVGGGPPAIPREPEDIPGPPGSPGWGCGLPNLTVSVELGTPGVGDPCKLAWALIRGHALPTGVLVEPLSTDAAWLTLGGHLQGGGSAAPGRGPQHSSQTPSLHPPCSGPFS